MLDLDEKREPSIPKDAATLLVLRGGDAGGVEIFCVRRHAKSAFMGGVVVFPGGKLDAADAALELLARTDGAHERAVTFADDASHGHALAVCACREALEEAGILPAEPAPAAARVEVLRSELDGHHDFRRLLVDADLTLSTSKLVPFARWVTPTAEARRYDARFFVTTLPHAQAGRHDEHETTSSVWASPREMLDAFLSGQLFLAPPTIRALEILGDATDVDSALALAAAQSLAPICPELVSVDPPTLALPGDPAHSVAERRVSGPTRFVLRDGKFVSEDP